MQGYPAVQPHLNRLNHFSERTKCSPQALGAGHSPKHLLFHSRTQENLKYCRVWQRSTTAQLLGNSSFHSRGRHISVLILSNWKHWENAECKVLGQSGPTAFTKKVSSKRSTVKKLQVLSQLIPKSRSITHQVQLRGFWKQFHIGPTTLYSILEVYFIPNFSFG